MTAVEWLHKIFKEREPDKFDWEQAKAMEKECMLDLIRFLITQDKMGKLINDLYEQYNTQKSKNK